MKNTKKSLLCLLMALVLALGMAACSAKEETADEPAKETFSAGDMVGTWADKTAGRATIEIAPAGEDGRYAILVSWGNSAFETYQWTMTAEAVENNVLYYDDCTHTIVTLAEGAKEPSVEEVYTGGHGQFALLGTNEIQWTDDIDNAGGDVLFISVK